MPVLRLGVVSLLAALPLLGQSPRFGVGRAPTPEEVKSWDISIAPDGTGLPEGSGTALQGKDIYASKCSKCHGTQAQGGDDAALVGGKGSLNTPKPMKTVASYWPYATTLWDYTSRAMPFKDPGSLNPNQVYAVVAYVLHLGGIIGESDAMNARTLPAVRMPNRDGFIPDARPDAGRKASKR
ncbi:MAG: cytochrome c [Bryobacteraceae bacterium]